MLHLKGAITMAILSTLLAALMLFAGTGSALQERPVQERAAQEDVVPFGDTFQGTRSTMTVSEPEPFTPSEYVPVEGERAVMATVTVTNEGSDVMQRYDFYASATCGGRAAPPIFDFESGLIGAGPPGDVLPGR